MSRRHRSRKDNTIYIDGNTVRRARTVEEIRYEEQRERERERRHRAFEREYALRRERERSSYMSAGYVLALAFAGIITLICCCGYLHTKAEINAHMDQVENLELKIENAKTKNDELQTKIDTYVDLDHVYQIATGELGMVYANPDQILLYDKTESEYVRQDEEIPQK